MSDTPLCPYCKQPMTLGDGSYWCMNKQCVEQFYPSGNDAPAQPSGEEVIFVYTDGVSRTLSQVESGAGRYVEIDRVEFQAQHYKLDDDEEVAELLAAYAAQQKERDAQIALDDLNEQPGVIVAAENRCDGGSSERTAKRIARAIREQQ